MKAFITDTHVAGDGMMVAKMVVRVPDASDLALFLSNAQADHEMVEVQFPGADGESGVLSEAEQAIQQLQESEMIDEMNGGLLLLGYPEGVEGIDFVDGSSLEWSEDAGQWIAVARVA